MRLNIKNLLGAFALLAASTTAAFAQTVTIPTVGDVWNYPFNFSPGFRTDISVFGAGQPVANDPMSGLVPGSLNYHDGIMLVEFGPSVLVSAVDYAPGGTPSTYDFDTATVTLTHVAADVSDPAFEWDLSSDFGVDDFFTSVPLYLNIHGVGFLTGDATSWSETDGYVGPCIPGCFGTPSNAPFSPRDPYPLSLSDSPSTTVENLSMPDSWASVVNTPGYTPGVTLTDFPVEFELDVSNPRVKAYIQEGLASGDLLFSVISNADSSGGVSGGGSTVETFPRFESNPSVPGSNAASATITFTNFVNGNSSVNRWDSYE